MTHGPGMIVLPCQELARYHRFTEAIVNTKKPEGTHLMMGVGMSIADNLNTAIRAMRDEDEWVWIVGDDHVWSSDALELLLDRQEDIIAPLCLQRFPPFAMVHWDEQVTDEVYNTVQIGDLPTDGEPFEVEASGSLMLIRRHVLEAIGDPWYGHENWRISEDLYLSKRAREEGFKVMVDPAVTVAHIGSFMVRAAMKDGAWGVAIDYGHGYAGFYPGGLEQNAAALGKLEAVA